MRRTVVLGLAWLVALAACAGAPAGTTQPPSSAAIGDACSSDDDCIVSDFPGCCACPQCSPGEAKARSREAQKRAEARCAVVDCDMSICGVAGMCPPPEPASSFRARCTNRVCTLEPK